LHKKKSFNSENEWQKFRGAQSACFLHITIRHLAGGTSGLLQFGGASGLLQCLIDCPSAMLSTAIFTTQYSNKIYFYTQIHFLQE